MSDDPEWFAVQTLRLWCRPSNLLAGLGGYGRILLFLLGLASLLARYSWIGFIRQRLSCSRPCSF